MNAIKKFSTGAWIVCATAVLSLAALIAYLCNVAGAGYFQDASVSNQVLFPLLAACAEVIAIAVVQVKMNGTVSDLVSGVCQIVAPVLLTAALIGLVAARAEGLGFIYFSNADVALEVQTPENLASATGTIVNMVLLGVAAVAGMVGAFCKLKKNA